LIWEVDTNKTERLRDENGSYNNLVGLQKEDLTMREAGGNSERAKVLARGLFRYLSRDLLGETAPRPLGL
jgi:hypothetical protein